MSIFPPVNYCPRCKQQRTWHWAKYKHNVAECDHCDLQMLYDPYSERLKLL